MPDDDAPELKLFVAVGDSKFRASGPAEIVMSAFAEFRTLVVASAPKTICHHVYGYEWEGVSAMPDELSDALQAGNLVDALDMGLVDLGEVEFTSGASAKLKSKLVSPLPFVTDSLASIYVYPTDSEAEESTLAQAREIADLVVTSRTVEPIEVEPTQVPPGAGCPILTVLVLGVVELG